MKKIIFFLLLNFLFIKNLSASNSIFDSIFYKIDIKDQIISDAKNKKIDEIKILSLYDILKNILTKKDFKIFKRKIKIKEEINFLIKNINIENEFILTNRYTANIKVNFDKKEIVRLLRNYKINYSDTESSNLLFIAIENNILNKEGLSKNNIFYQKINLKKFGLLNFQYPDLSPNDRFVLSYKDIKKINLNSLKNISKKYNARFVIIINITAKNHIYDLEINMFSSITNKIIDTYNFQTDKNNDFQNQLLLLILDWWKKFNIIEHNKINKKLCFIKNSNINELYFIISKIKSISQVKSLSISKINLGMNLYEFIYYGDSNNLFLKLSRNNIIKKINTKDQCILFINN